MLVAGEQRGGPLEGERVATATAASALVTFDCCRAAIIILRSEASAPLVNPIGVGRTIRVGVDHHRRRLAAAARCAIPARRCRGEACSG